MTITVTGKQIDIGTALSEHVQTRLEGGIDKYFNQNVEGSVTFSKNAHLLVADINLHLGHGVYLQTKAEETEIYASFDVAAERMEKRLRRYKRRITNHHKDRNGHSHDMAAQYNVLESEEDEAVEDETLNPAIIAEMEVNVPHVSVSDAVMRLDLGNLQTLMFRNTSHGGLNVIYRRQDGNIGWIDPQTNE